MRRLLAYVSLAAAVVLGVGVTANAVLTKVKSDNTFSDGKTITFRLSDIEGGSETLDAYEDDKAAKGVADIMSKRLQNWGVTSYKVTAVGNDTIEATFTADTDEEYKDISRYLRFSGQNYSISSEDEEIDFTHEEMFKDSVARIEYKGYAPIVVIPVSDGETLKSKVGEAADSAPTDEDGHSEGVTLYLWANKEEGDTYEEANENPYIQDKFVMAFNSNNLWYIDEPESTPSEDIQYHEIEYICGSATEEGYYDTNSTDQAYYQAKKFVNLFNAEALDFEVKELFSTDVSSSVEDLVVLGDKSVNLAFSATLKSTLIAVVVIALVLVLFYKLNAISTIIPTIATSYLTLLFFVLTGSEFNVAAVVGFILVNCLSLFAGIHYSSRVKEEIYRGKSMKKANSEASKRNTLAVVDSSVIAIVFGIMLYIMGGSLIAPMGFMVALGGLINLILSLSLLKLMNNLMFNSTKVQKKYKLFNIDAELVSNPLEDNSKKETYQGAYQKVDFTKKKKVAGIVSGAFAGITLVMAIIFSALKGSAYNLSSNSSNSKIYFELEDTHSEIADSNYIKNNILKNIYIKDGKDFKPLDGYVSDIDHETGSFYDEETKLNNEVEFYVVNLTIKLDTNIEALNAKAIIDEEAQTFTDVANIQDILVDYVVSGELDTTAEISVKNTHNVASQIITNNAIWSSLIAIAICAIYLAFRFRPSRGIAAFIISVLNAFITLGLFIVTRIACTQIVTIAGIFVAMISLIASIYFFSKEKELRKEVNTRHQEMSMETKHEIVVKALGISVNSLIVLAAATCYLAINYFGFGPTAFAIMFGGILIGLVITYILVLTILGPTAEVFDKLLSKIKIKPRNGIAKAKKRAEKDRKNRSAEPEESPVIGINI